MIGAAGGCRRGCGNTLTAEEGMAQMSEKFKEMGNDVYVAAEKVKESNRVL